MKSDQSAERKFLKIISSQKFYEWYSDGGPHDRRIRRYLMGDMKCKTEKQILADIKKFLK